MTATIFKRSFRFSHVLCISSAVFVFLFCIAISQQWKVPTEEVVHFALPASKTWDFYMPETEYSYVSSGAYSGSYLLTPKLMTPNASIIIFAYTRTFDFSLRQTIRETWGRRELLLSSNMFLVFPLGLSEDILAKQIRKENDRYGDILQGNFTDSYKNLSYKGILALKWASEITPQVKYIVKVDSDIFLNTLSLQEVLMSELMNRGPNLIGCKVHWHSKVLRPKLWCGKWCVSQETFHQNFYPPYCWGSFYVIDGGTVRKLYEASKVVPVWWVADVYITGLLPLKVGLVKRVMLHEFFEDEPSRLASRLTNFPQGILFGFVRTELALRSAWKMLSWNHITDDPFD